MKRFLPYEGSSLQKFVKICNVIGKLNRISVVGFAANSLRTAINPTQLQQAIKQSSDLTTHTLMSDRRAEGTGSLRVLPDHVIATIFSFFSYKELVYISSVSATFYVFCNDEGVWQDIYMEDTNSTFAFDGSWKHATLLKHKKTDKELTLPKTLHFDGSFLYPHHHSSFHNTLCICIHHYSQLLYLGQ